MKPNCKATACGNTCISGKYSCRSRVQADSLVAKVHAPPVATLLQEWDSAFTYSTRELRELVAVLPQPDRVKAEGPFDAFCTDDGIAMGASMSRRNALHRRIFAHEYGHWVDRKLHGKAADNSLSFETLSGGMTVNDIRLLADLHKTSLGAQLDALAGRLRVSSQAMSDSYFSITSPASIAYDKQHTSYISTSVGVHEAFRQDEQRLLASVADPSSTLKTLQKYGPLVTDSAMPDTLDSLTKGGGMVGGLLALAKINGAPITQQLVLTLLSKRPDRIAKLADSLLDYGAMFQDLVGSLTGNVVGSGHTDKYYATGLPYRARNTETFANLFALHASGDKLVQDIAEYLAPAGYKAIYGAAQAA